MEKKGVLRLCLGGVAGILLIFWLFGIVQGNAPIDDSKHRADIITIDSHTSSNGKHLRTEANKQMPAVDFFHDRHTQALEGDICRTCHLTKDDRLVFLFKRLETVGPEGDREIYHTNCIGCHADLAAAGSSSGPSVGNCRGCHSRRPEAAFSWIPLLFSPSLHYRHVSAELIPPSPGMETNCSACHHQYDAVLQKTEYIKGEESSCHYCHPAQAAMDGRLPRPNRFGMFRPPASLEALKSTGQMDPPDKSIRFMAAAAHDTCVSCHWQLTATHNRRTGPLNCAGCHTHQAQKKIPVLESVPRMKRNQPDAVLMAAWLDRVDLSPQTISTEINPVAFDHKAHEIYGTDFASCRRCHHNALKPCGDCHIRSGSVQGDFISLNQAMHDLESVGTCIGCHRDQTGANADCAGCHAARSKSGFGDHDCRVCHVVEKTELPSMPPPKPVRAELAAETLVARRDARKAMGTLPPLEQIPERVRIDALVETYEAVDLPHRKIVLELNRRIQNSELAQAFHTDPLTLCVGCHHHSPPALKPPKCASCHSRYQPSLGDGRPALMGAYHNQCMGCHHRMGIQKPQATACIECHPKRDQQNNIDDKH